jgi:hypothetical protein
MPTFDGGHYFLTALIPIRTDTMPDGDSGTSPVHALRKVLDMMPTAAETIADNGRQSLFAGNTRNHFARLVIIDDVAYNGRDARDTLVATAGSENLTAAQPQDHLSCPFLLLAVDFDAESGDASERDSYLAKLWTTASDGLQQIFQFCEGFTDEVRDESSFAAYVAKCQLDTTMSFNDYYVDPLNLPTWPAKWYVAPVAIFFVVLVLGVLAGLLSPFFFPHFRYGWVIAGLGAVALGLSVWVAYLSAMAAGAKPFPAAPDSDLPTVLKALYLQRVFTSFAVAQQPQALGADPASAAGLRDAFKTFLNDNKPSDISDPSQKPGFIGI